MRPKSTTSLLFCVFVALAAAAFLVARVIGLIEVHWITVVLACLVGASSAFLVIKEYFRKPFVRDYHHEDWIVTNPEDRKGVCIRISKSEHGSGNKPHYTFLNKGIGYSVDLDVSDNDGDLTIYHPANSFMPRYKSFVIRII